MPILDIQKQGHTTCLCEVLQDEFFIRHRANDLVIEYHEAAAFFIMKAAARKSPFIDYNMKYQ
jgi:hypothetical protein